MLTQTSNPDALGVLERGMASLALDIKIQVRLPSRQDAEQNPEESGHTAQALDPYVQTLRSQVTLPRLLILMFKL